MPEGPTRGTAALLVDAVVGATEVVETMHARISPIQPNPRDWSRGRAGGLTGLIYRSIRGVARLTGRLLGPAIPRLGVRTAPRSRAGQALIAALNGVAGDHLAGTASSLAQPMRLRRAGRPLELSRDALARDVPSATGRVVVLVHGLCMNDLQWLRRGHDHGAALERDLDYTPLYLQYNTGLHTSRNGEMLADLVESLLDAWPVAVQEVSLIGHSMGGLVARSACHRATVRGHRWVGRLRAVLCLGTPHHGSPLEAAGLRLHHALAATPYTAPLARVSAVRSAGITDLRHGNLIEEDWAGQDRFAAAPGPDAEIRFPAHARCYLVAASAGRRAGDLRDRIFGDFLVPTSSALGRSARAAARSLDLPPEQTWTGYGMGHLDLLDHPEVYTRIRGWLS